MQAAVVFAALLTSAVDGGLNYCGAKMCAQTNSHTFCQYPEGPGPYCTGYMEDHLTNDEKARVLARLNRRRSEAALGKLLQLPTAGNMLKLRWVEELAREAQIWADQCRPPATPEEHDACRDLYSITVGQCVASVTGEAPGLRPESMVDTWYLQGLQYRGNVTMYSTNNKRNHKDFAQILWAQTYLVGCARSQFMSELSGRMRTVTRLVCNFAPRGPAGALWLPAAPASACPPGSHPAPSLPGLCEYQTDAVFGATNEMSLEEQTVLNAVLEIERNASLEYHGSLDEIYLTIMAIATLSKPVITKSFPKPTQSHDIFEPIFMEDKQIVIPGNNLQLIDDVIDKMVQERSSSTTVTTKLVQKVHIVGRPKSYNIEDLNDEDKEDSGKTRPVETTAMLNDKDSYAEYEFTEIPEIESIENTSSTEWSPIITDSTETTNVNLPTTPPITTTTQQGTTLPEIASVNEAENITIEENVTNAELIRLLELSKKNEENPWDQETARQLQEALERMEQCLAAQNSKVRRELRRHSQMPPRQGIPGRDMYDTLLNAAVPEPYQYPQKTTTQAQGEPKKPYEKGPVMGLVFKYLPFMKHYESSIVGSAAPCCRPGYLMLILVYLGVLE